MADKRSAAEHDPGKYASQDTENTDDQSGNGNIQGTQQGSCASLGRQPLVKMEDEGGNDNFQPPSACFICVMQDREEECDYDFGGKTPCTYCSNSFDRKGLPLRCTRPGKARRQGAMSNGRIDPRDVQPNGAGRGRGRGGGVRGRGDLRGGRGGYYPSYAPVATSPVPYGQTLKDREERYRLLEENNGFRERYEKLQEKHDQDQEEIKKLQKQLDKIGEEKTKVREENIRMQAQLELFTSDHFKPIVKRNRDADGDENIRGAKRLRDIQVYDQPASTFESPRGYPDADGAQHSVFAPQIPEGSRRQRPSWLHDSANPSPTPAHPGDQMCLPPRETSFPDGRLSASPMVHPNMNFNAQQQRSGETLANGDAHASGSVNTGWLPHPWVQPWDGRDYRPGYGNRYRSDAVDHQSIAFTHEEYRQSAEQFQHARDAQNSTVFESGQLTSQLQESQYGQHYGPRRSHGDVNVNPQANDHHDSTAAQSEAWGNYYRTEDDHNFPASRDDESYEITSRSSKDRARARGHQGPMR